MGENKHIEELDAFAKKHIQEIKNESPSLNFTNSIMGKIINEETSKKIFTSKALISKKVWALIILLLSIVVFASSRDKKESLISLPELDFSFLDKIQISNLFESIAISNTVLISVFLFGLMLIAQLIFLKKHFSKRFD